MGLAEPKQAQPAKAGGARRDRTADLVIANDALSQLSYGPLRARLKRMRKASNRGHLQSAPRPSQERRNHRFPGAWPRTSLVCAGWNRYLAVVESAIHPRPASKPAMRAVLDIVLIVLDLYVWLLIASAILSWLIAFNVVNTRNQFVAAVAEFLYRITEPLLAPIRSFMPNLGGLDISPIILILIIMFLQRVITYYIYPSVF
jgi:YggT family protein